MGSYQNGQIIDLYFDHSRPAVNCKVGRPIPGVFAMYDNVSIAAAPTRGPEAYPPDWSSYHSAHHDPTRPTVMDDYRIAPSPEACQNDEITRRFVMDRVRAKLSR
jgi:hypothetical protein